MGLTKATVGFRVKSGWASLVLLAEPVEAPHVLDHHVVNLSDPGIPGTRQPYHAAQGTLEQDSARLAKRVRRVQEITKKSVNQLLEEYQTRCTVKSSGLAVGSLVEPSSIANPHIRAHALEGRLFRNALENALRLQGLNPIVLTERKAYSQASSSLRLPEDTLKRMVSDISRTPSRPWRADQKLAALAAWAAMGATQKSC